MSTFGKSLLRSKQRDHADRRKKYVEVLEARNQAHAQSMSRRVGGSAEEKTPDMAVAAGLKSVWETNEIESFLQLADQRKAGYASDRAVQVVVDGAAHVLVGDKVKPLSDAQRDWLALSAELPIPKRPAWNFEMTAQDVNIHELAAFSDWRHTLNSLEEHHKVFLSPYEKNLEVWRQLWRVVERSDIVVNVVDARNPLAFRCRDFENYVAQHTSATTSRVKPLIVLLNKADLLTERQRTVWAEYLNRTGVVFYFFCAKPPDMTAHYAQQREDQFVEEERRLRQELKQAAVHQDNDDDDDDDEDDEEYEDIDSSDDSSSGGEDDEPLNNISNNKKPLPKKQARRGAKHRPLRGQPVQLVDQERGTLTKQANLSDEAARRAAEYERQLQIEEQQMMKERHMQQLQREKALRQQAQAAAKKGMKPAAKPSFPPLPPVPPGTSKVYGADELLELFATYWRDRVVLASADQQKSNSDNSNGDAASSKPRHITVGFTGYPNVGKSSTINAFIGAKKVVVSATPGKTKHLQTLPIPQEPRVMLCDCPGLVFPTCAATRETMVCDGVLPVDNCRDFVAPISVVCRRIPRVVFEHHYHLAHETVDVANDVDHSTSVAEVLLAAVARKRGYMTDHERPNRSRAARDVLKDFVDGKMVYVHPPPDLMSIPQAKEWSVVSEMAKRLYESASSVDANQHQQQEQQKGSQKRQNNHDDDDGGNDQADDEEPNEAEWQDADGDEEEVEWEDMDSDLDEARDLSDGEDSEPAIDPATAAALLSQRQLNVGAQFFDVQNIAATTANAGSALSSERWKHQQIARQQQVRTLTVDEVFNMRPEIIAFVASEETRKQQAAQQKIAALNAANAAAGAENHVANLANLQQQLMQQRQQQAAASAGSAVVAGVEVEFDEDDEIVASFAHAVTDPNSGGGKKKRRKMKSHQAVLAAPDPTFRITSQGHKQIVFDDDDEIDVFMQADPAAAVKAAAAAAGGGGGDGGAGGEQQKRLTKRQLRRIEKREIVKPKADGDGVVKKGIAALPRPPVQ